MTIAVVRETCYSMIRFLFRMIRFVRKEVILIVSESENRGYGITKASIKKL